MSPVAAGLAGFHAYPSHDGREGVVCSKGLKGLEIMSRLGMRHPFLDVFTCRAGAIAWRHEIHIFRTPEPFWASAFSMKGKINRFGNINHCIQIILKDSPGKRTGDKVEFNLNELPDFVQGAI